MITGRNDYLVKALNQFASLTAALTHRFSPPAKASIQGYSDHRPTQKKPFGPHRRRKSGRTDCCVTPLGKI